ncbi:ATPase family gene 2 protein [Diplodia seriata]|uniref:ATPase family gene 2 protein n=1 Tax=Diplodia seriata TaxID=420778 RepID=A0A1S8BJ56_9PEZI|nr:ATPase family gene 2 protein [Diplodia seriata]
MEMPPKELDPGEELDFEKFFSASVGLNRHLNHGAKVANDPSKVPTTDQQNNIPKFVSTTLTDDDQDNPSAVLGESVEYTGPYVKARQLPKKQQNDDKADVLVHSQKSHPDDSELISTRKNEGASTSPQNPPTTVVPGYYSSYSESQAMSKYFGQTSKTHLLYGITSDEDEDIIRWSEYPDPKEEERVFMARARSYAIIHRKVSPEHPVYNQMWESHSLEVQSPRLRQALKEVLQGYPNVNLDAPTLKFKPPYAAFVHRWRELKEKRQQLEGSTRLEIDMLIEEMTLPTAADREAMDKFAETGLLEWQKVWLIFVPGELIFKTGSTNELFSLESTELFDKNDVPEDDVPHLKLHLKQVDWDGERFGYWRSIGRLDHFNGECFVSTLKWSPLRYFQRQSNLVEDILERGRKFESLHGYHHRAYNGNKYTRDWERSTTDASPRALRKPVCKRIQGLQHEPTNPTQLTGRVIIDAFAYHKFEYAGGVRPNLSSLPKEAAKAEEERSPDEHDDAPRPLTVEQLLICMPRVKGFDLQDNEWCEFDVNGIRDIDFKDDAFQKLMIPKEEKRLLKAFMNRNELDEHSWDDVVPGKGKGIIILLYGPPGVGKTLTAESISEDEMVPLYRLSASERGTAIKEAETQLNIALECCKLWNAVLLIDEADVFLGARSATSKVQQNELVSVFLRRLEYYQGLLFLTTNRFSSIDEAFRSRVDLILPFRDLDQSTRAAIWKTFIDAVPKANRTVSPTDVEALSQHKLNGRDIKNVVKSARLLAHSENLPLSMQHLDLLLTMKLRNLEDGQNK